MKKSRHTDGCGGFSVVCELHQLQVQSFDLLDAGVAGIAGTASIVKGGLSQEIHVLGLDDVLQIGGDAHVHYSIDVL